MDSVKRKLKQITNHESIEITNRGNSAIFAALNIAKKVNNKKYILIPDQGGWFTYRIYPQIFGFVPKELKTNDGLIITDELKKYIRDASALLVPSFAGYFAEQNIHELSEICTKHNCLLIEDASGAIGDQKLCDGRYSDIIVASFGKWKPVNVGYGGFISCNAELMKKAELALSLIKVHPNSENEILAKLNENRLPKMISIAQAVKKHMSGADLIHENKRGINVMTEYSPFVVDYCKERGYPYLLCPNYIRLNRKAISIELKRAEYE
ncbi:MAG: DegT/DnrJ/EryC1/StrS family aminotransferase [Nanoarchaeota archaeon]|nr:DegT/DnrJ/EryC1/StrS family aminotransferase [Nanoarchaeota archaeon]MBU0962612.1 DegT/DnrJ/EryC1/StrS family aminotransferase [Nanoarchaeota archaeon]